LKNNSIKKEENVKEKNEKKLSLGKITLSDIAPILDRDEQIRIKAGFDVELVGITILPVYC
jgi:hypothetical protein